MRDTGPQLSDSCRFSTLCNAFMEDAHLLGCFRALFR